MTYSPCNIDYPQVVFLFYAFIHKEGMIRSVSWDSILQKAWIFEKIRISIQVSPIWVKMTRLCSLNNPFFCCFQSSSFTLAEEETDPKSPTLWWQLCPLVYNAERGITSFTRRAPLSTRLQERTSLWWSWMDWDTEDSERCESLVLASAGSFEEPSGLPFGGSQISSGGTGSLSTKVLLFNLSCDG